MQSDATVLSKLNTSNSYDTLLMQRDNCVYVYKQIPPEQYTTLKKLHDFQQVHPSPYIASIYCVENKTNDCYIEQEWIRGKSLDEILTNETPLS